MAKETLPATTTERGVVDLSAEQGFLKILEESGLDAKQRDFVLARFEDVGIKHQTRSGFICCGLDCISAHICPFIADGRTDLLPINKPCPVDIYIGQKYYHAILLDMKENQIEHNGASETLLRELVSIEIYVSRIDDYMSRNLIDSREDGRDGAPLTARKVVPVNMKTGEVRYDMIEHPLIKTREGLEDRRSKILQKLLLTPEIRTKMKIGAADSLSKLLEQQRKNAQEAIKNAKKHGDVTIEDIQKRANERMQSGKPQHNEGV